MFPLASSVVSVLALAHLAAGATYFQTDNISGSGFLSAFSCLVV
jgi:hypothetical protein